MLAMSVYLVRIVYQLEIAVSGCLGEGQAKWWLCSLVPRPNPPDKEEPGIHCLRMCVIIYAKTDEEGHMTFPMHVLDDVTYCTRTKPGLELYFADSLPTLRSLQSMTNGIVSMRNGVIS